VVRTTGESGKLVWPVITSSGLSAFTSILAHIRKISCLLDELHERYFYLIW
jgi:hypothetical protein